MIYQKTKLFPVALCLILIGSGGFIWMLASGHPDQAWRAYLVNFLLFSAVCQGAVLFSAMMNTVKAEWTGRLAGLAEAFIAFFPVSFVLFLGLFWGREYIFPWLHHDLHGKEVWLNLPFLFTRDLLGLLILYGLGFAYFYYTLGLKTVDPTGRVPSTKTQPDADQFRQRQYIFGVLYLLAFALVLSLIGYDLVMSADPEWYSTLFGAYSFVKAIYVGFGALIILAAYLHLHKEVAFELSSQEFLDMGKLFFAFCLVWADFFYCQLVVIWYGNLPEETAFIIDRTMIAPWSNVAWIVFSVCFILPFLILLNRKIKTLPRFMLVVCSVVIMGMWLEHYLLLGPSLESSGHSIPISIMDVSVGLGFGGLLILAVSAFLNRFPQLLRNCQPHSEERV